MYFPSTTYYTVKGSAPFDPLPLTAGLLVVPGRKM